MNNIKILISNEEVVCDKNLVITEEMLSTSSVILNNCYPKKWEDEKDYNNKFYCPLDYSKCLIYNNDKLIFCGVVKNTGNINLNPRYPHYCTLQVLDFKYLLSEGETLDFVLDNVTIKQAIEQVIQVVESYGFIVGVIDINNENEIIGAYSTQNKTAYDVLQYLADISNSRWFTRLIDENTIAIDFYDPSKMKRKQDIDYQTSWFEDNKVCDLSFNYGGRDYRNKQIVISNEVKSEVLNIENFVCSGSETSITLQHKISKITRILLNNRNMSFATDLDKELGINADFYYSPGKDVLEVDTELSTNDIIEVYYYPMVKGRQIVYNELEIERINNQTNRNGVLSRYEVRNDIGESYQLSQVGESYLRFKGTAEIIIKLVTEKDLYSIGDITFFNSPIDMLKTDYMVRKKETKMIIVNNYQKIFYTYELVSNFNSERAINYFDNQRNKVFGNLKTGEIIERNFDIENSCLITYEDLSITEIEITGDNTLNCVLDAPFVC